MLTGSSQIMAQVKNDLTVYIGEDILFYSEMPVSNTGFFMNRGVIDLSADWINTGTYQGSGRLRITGTNNIIFRHDGDPFAFLEVETNGQVTQQGEVVVSQEMNLLSGIWNTTTSDRLLILRNGDVRGGGTSSFVNGPLHREGTGFRFFPIGNGLDYLPLRLTNVSGISPVLEAVVRRNVPPDITAPEDGQVFRDFYWQTTAYGITYSGSPVEISFPPNILRAEYLGLLYGTDLTPGALDFVPAETETYGNPWKLRSRGTLLSGYLVLAERPIPVTSQQAFYFPNTFSPNATNDEDRKLKIFGDLLNEPFKLVIYNRQGHVVYQTNDLGYIQEEGWDGSGEGGILLPAGSYPYYLKALSALGKPIEQKGIISIVR